MNTHIQIEAMYYAACHKVENGKAKSAHELFTIKTGPISDARLEVVVRPTTIGLRGTWSLNYARITKAEAVKLMRQHDYLTANQ